MGFTVRVLPHYTPLEFLRSVAFEDHRFLLISLAFLVVFRDNCLVFNEILFMPPADIGKWTIVAGIRYIQFDDTASPSAASLPGIPDGDSRKALLFLNWKRCLGRTSNPRKIARPAIRVRILIVTEGAQSI